MYIATTEGPSRVLGVVEEDPGVMSVVCLDFKADALPVSAGYQRFVRQPTGVIEKYWGHGAFRMDVSHPIDAGSSWQLGALAAHALLADGRLAAKDEKPDRAVWLTGEVNNHLQVGPVEHVDEKVAASQSLFEELKAQGVPVTLFVPRANLKHAKGAPDGCEVVPADKAGEVLTALGLGDPLKPKTVPAVMDAPKRGGGMKWAAVVVLLLAGGLGAAVVQDRLSENAVTPVPVEPESTEPVEKPQEKPPETKPEQAVETEPETKPEQPPAKEPEEKEPEAEEKEPEAKEPEPAKLDVAAFAVTASETRISRFQDCAQANLDGVAPVSVALGEGGRFALSKPSGLCRVEYALANSGAVPANAWLRVSTLAKGGSRPLADPVESVGEAAPDGSLVLKVDMTRWRLASVVNRILVIAGTSPLDAAKARIAKDGDGADVVQALRDEGYVVRTLTHPVGRPGRDDAPPGGRKANGGEPRFR